MRIRNVSANKIFIESLQFNPIVAIKDVLHTIDLNQAVRSADSSQEFVEEGLFDESVCFHQDEVRHYLFLLKPIKPKFRIDNTMQHRLGSVNIKWRNYMGDFGELELE